MVSFQEFGKWDLNIMDVVKITVVAQIYHIKFVYTIKPDHSHIEP